MKSKSYRIALAMLFLAGVSPSFAGESPLLISILPAHARSAKAKAHPTAHPSSRAKAAAEAKKKPVKATAKTATTPAAKTAAKPATKTAAREDAPAAADENTAAESAEQPAAPVHNLYSAGLEQAARQYKAAPTPASYSQMLEALKAMLSGAGARVPAAVVARDNPYLSDLKPRVIEAGGARIWGFGRFADRGRALLQWYDSKQQTVGTGRRKKVVTTVSQRLQELTFSSPLNVRDAGIVSNKEAGRHLLLAGDADDGALVVQAYKLTETGWQASPEFIGQLPAFLSSNVTGRVAFRGSDMIVNVGKMIQTVDSAGTRRNLPEAESATYKFLLKSTDNGYVVVPAVPDEDSFSVVFQFMQAVQQSRTDVEKSLLADARLSSLPKYLGLQGKPLDTATRVVEMTVPPARGQRFRLINAGKDDIIFDVGKTKGQWQIKSLFIAPQDPFLIETAKYFPPYSSFVQKAETKAESQEKKDADSAPSAGAVGSGARKR